MHLSALWHHVVFVDPVFLLGFIPICVLGFVVLSFCGARNLIVLWLIAASFTFYVSWGWRFFAIFTGSMLCNFTARQVMLRYAAQDRPRAKKAALAVIVAANICCIAFFKYRGFLAGTVAPTAGAISIIASARVPLGISFYTFQEITLAVDAYRGAYKSSFIEYVLFISFFPHLVSGPLVHHSEMIQQFRRFRLRFRDLMCGASLIAIGLFKKTCLADPLAPFVQGVFDHGAASMPGCAAAWLGALAYGLELYFDFSGYSDMALGFARLFGVRLPVNFNSPYKATDVIDFWRRWHLTLSRFLREYLYIPLGGNRHGAARRYANLMVVMLLGGLWHGANWTFVLWGGLHGLYLIVNHAWRALQRRFALPTLPGVGFALTFVAVTVAWVAFRAPDLQRAFGLWGAMFLPGFVPNAAPTAAPSFFVTIAGPDSALGLFVCWLAVLCLVATAAPNSMQIMGITRPFPGPPSWAPRTVSSLRWRPTAAWGLLMGAIVGCVVLVGRGVTQQFLYWSF